MPAPHADGGVVLPSVGPDLAHAKCDQDIVALAPQALRVEERAPVEARVGEEGLQDQSRWFALHAPRCISSVPFPTRRSPHH